MFSRIFIERPRFAMVISIVLSIAGLISVFSLPIALYPEITPPEIGNLSRSKCRSCGPYDWYPVRRAD